MKPEQARSLVTIYRGTLVELPLLRSAMDSCRFLSLTRHLPNGSDTKFYMVSEVDVWSRWYVFSLWFCHVSTRSVAISVQSGPKP